MKSQREILADNLERLIDERGIDQKILAERIGVSDMTISNWVRGLKYPRIDKLQALADFFSVKHVDLVTEKITDLIMETPSSYRAFQETKYDFYPMSVAAGLPSTIDSLTEDDIEQIAIPDIVMGKWSNRTDVFITRVNGDSMNEVIPHESLIAVKKLSLDNLNNNDVVVFSNDHEYSVKRYYNDKENERFIFSSESTDRSFTDHIVPYEETNNLIIHGKVVVYIVNLD